MELFTFILLVVFTWGIKQTMWKKSVDEKERVDPPETSTLPAEEWSTFDATKFSSLQQYKYPFIEGAFVVSQ